MDDVVLHRVDIVTLILIVLIVSVFSFSFTFLARFCFDKYCKGGVKVCNHHDSTPLDAIRLNYAHLLAAEQNERGLGYTGVPPTNETGTFRRLGIRKSGSGQRDLWGLAQQLENKNLSPIQITPGDHKVGDEKDKSQITPEMILNHIKETISQKNLENKIEEYIQQSIRLQESKTNENKEIVAKSRKKDRVRHRNKKMKDSSDEEESNILTKNKKGGEPGNTVPAFNDDVFLANLSLSESTNRRKSVTSCVCSYCGQPLTRHEDALSGEPRRNISHHQWPNILRKFPNEASPILRNARPSYVNITPIFKGPEEEIFDRELERKRSAMHTGDSMFELGKQSSISTERRPSFEVNSVIKIPILSQEPLSSPSLKWDQGYDYVAKDSESEDFQKTDDSIDVTVVARKNSLKSNPDFYRICKP